MIGGNKHQAVDACFEPCHLLGGGLPVIEEITSIHSLHIRGRFVTLFSAPEGLPPPMCWHPYRRSSLLAADGEEGLNWNRERYDELTAVAAGLTRLSPTTSLRCPAPGRFI